MKIAVLGWGSLIWCPGFLKIKTRWQKDGPNLPIEFARMSSRDRLTLVIHPGVDPQRTLWALSSSGSIEDARRNLAEREGTIKGQIHAIEKDGSCHGDIRDDIKEVVRGWLNGRTDDFAAAVWTGLKSNWKDVRGEAFSADDALSYLKFQQQHNTWKAAKEYLCNAPAQITTELRKRVERELGWSPSHLPDVLFEDPK